GDFQPNRAVGRGPPAYSVCGNCAATTADQPQPGPTFVPWMLRNDRVLSATVGSCARLQRTSNPNVAGSIPPRRTNKSVGCTRSGLSPDANLRFSSGFQIDKRLPG